ncbi:unnamed protein product, partial [Discosporangium mesarthrocarpum]
DDRATGGGQGRHRIFLAEIDEETVVLKGYALVSALQRKGLERELGILWRIKHDAIIRAEAIVEDLGAELPVPMLYIQERPAWEMQSAFRQMMCAVLYLHDRGVIHKDIKPGNILVHADGRFLLADFDVSKDTLAGHGGATSSGPHGPLPSDTAPGQPTRGPMGGQSTMDTETMRAGTRGFMAPEA